jgi:KUP system potassium uptake protein
LHHARALLFKQSSALAAAYGIAVTGTMAISATAFFVVARTRWGWSLAQALPLLVLFLAVDLTFFASNVLKFLDGGYVPIVIALGLFMVMRIWKRGRALCWAITSAAPRARSTPTSRGSREASTRSPLAR